MDAVLFLLNQGVNQARITWIMPSDSWMLERDQLWIGQPPPPPLMTEGADLERVARDAGDDPARQAFGQMETMGALLRYLRVSTLTCVSSTPTQSFLRLMFYPQKRACEL